VVVLDAGRVVEQGTVAELIARGGWFAQFAASTHGTEVEEEASGEEVAADDGVDEDEEAEATGGETLKEAPR